MANSTRARDRNSDSPTSTNRVSTLDSRFERLFAAECGCVIRTLRRLGVRDGDVEDLAQDVFLAVHHRFADYDPKRPPRPWLFAFAFRAASNYKRLARHRREARDDTEHGRGPEQEHQLEAARRREMLLDALQTLDLEHRAAIIAVDLDQVPAKDAAAAMGIPLNTLYSRVRNGRKKLRAALTSSPDADQRQA